MKAEDIKILGVTFTYNNEDKIPYVMPYYERMGIDKLVVYDNESTDSTVLLLKQYPFVEIRTYHTDRYDENLVLKYKTEIQNEFAGKYDWCVSTYFDEVFFSERDFREVLYEKMCEGKTYFLKTGLNIFSRHFPVLGERKLIHESVGRGSLWTSDDGLIGIYGNKVQLFDMSKVFVTYNEWGCHECSISGQTSPFEDEIGFFHIKFIDYDFIVRSNAEYKERMKGTGILCYDYFAENMEKVYQMLEKRAISIDEYMNSKMYQLIPQQVVFVVNEKDPERRKNYVDVLSSLSENSIIQQYGLLFYGNGDYDKENWVDLWLYAKNKGIYIMNNENMGNPRVAVYNYRHYFEKDRIHDPWIAELPSTSVLTPEFFTKMEAELKEFANKNIRICEINDIQFMRYIKYVSNGNGKTLGCYMIVKNEEQSIGKCLDSLVRVCDEIVVVDTGCDDETMNIVRSYGDKIKTYYFKWCNDFSAARNFAMSKIESDYSFTTDADEELSPKLIETINYLKDNGFNGNDYYDIWLLNYNGTDNLRRYLGGRQIVNMKNNRIWKYKIHEKLYTNAINCGTISLDDGYILHKHNSNNVAVSNYNKYAETYFNEMNSGDILNIENSVHFYYYMFLTLKDLDYFASKRYLYNAFEKHRIAVPNEDIRIHLYKDEYISLEEFTVFEMIQKEDDINLMVRFAETLTNETAKYILLKHLYDTTPRGVLSLDNMLYLAYTSYINGLIDDFVKITIDSVSIYGKVGSIGHNIGFIGAYVEPCMKNNVVIDCRVGTNGLASNVYYLSKMFNKITILCRDKSICDNFAFNSVKQLNFAKSESEIDGKYYLINGDVQLDKKTAFEEFENVMYGRQSYKLVMKNGGD